MPNIHLTPTQWTAVEKLLTDFGLTVILSPILMLGLAFATPFALVILGVSCAVTVLFTFFTVMLADGIITLVAGSPFFGTYDSSFQISFRIGYALFLSAFALDSIHEFSMTRIGKYIVIAFTIVMSLAISHHITVEPSELTLSEALRGSTLLVVWFAGVMYADHFIEAVNAET